MGVRSITNNKYVFSYFRLGLVGTIGERYRKKEEIGSTPRVSSIIVNKLPTLYSRNGEMNTTIHHHQYLKWRKEWICSKRPITICAIVKGWMCQGSLIWHQREVTREQGPIRALVLCNWFTFYIPKNVQCVRSFSWGRMLVTNLCSLLRMCNRSASTMSHVMCTMCTGECVKYVQFQLKNLKYHIPTL